MLSVLLLLAAATSAQAGPVPAVACRDAEPVPAALRPFARADRRVAMTRAGRGEAALTVGQASDVAFHPVAAVRFPVTPGRGPAAGTHGGTLAFDVARPGTYAVALGGRGWIDVAARGRLLPSVAHGHGPRCSGIAKVVRFRLAAGRHYLQVANLPERTARVLIVRD